MVLPEPGEFGISNNYGVTQPCIPPACSEEMALPEVTWQDEEAEAHVRRQHSKRPACNGTVSSLSKKVKRQDEEVEALVARQPSKISACNNEDSALLKKMRSQIENHFKNDASNTAPLKFSIGCVSTSEESDSAYSLGTKMMSSLSGSQRSDGWIITGKPRPSGKRTDKTYRHLESNKAFRSLVEVLNFIKYGVYPDRVNSTKSEAKGKGPLVARPCLRSPRKTSMREGGQTNSPTMSETSAVLSPPLEQPKLLMSALPRPSSLHLSSEPLYSASSAELSSLHSINLETYYSNLVNFRCTY